MTTRPYYTLCKWDIEQQAWYDEVGHYSLADAKADQEAEDYPRGHAVIVKNDGSLLDLIAKRNALPVLKRPKG